MSVTLTPQTEEEIRRWIDSGRYPDADAVVHTALQALKDQEEAKLTKLRELVRAGFESGDAVELTDELWDEMERRSEERFLRGERPSPRVCP
jgi:putative addiction module CopG family antidote